MIVRVLTARVPRQHVGAFNEKQRALLGELRKQDGLVYVKLARRLDEHDGEEVVLFEEWRTPADLWAWTGGQLSRPRLLPGTEDLIDNLEISHYEALDVDPDEMSRIETRRTDPEIERAVREATRTVDHDTGSDVHARGTDA